MAVLPLSAITAGTDVYIDANIFIYAMLGHSIECRALLTRCGTDIFGYSDVRVLHDICHQLMLADAEQTSGDLSMRRPRELKGNPPLIRSLSRWQQQVLLVQQLPIEWIDLALSDISRMPQVATAAGLLCGDALHMSVMQT